MVSIRSSSSPELPEKAADTDSTTAAATATHTSKVDDQNATRASKSAITRLWRLLQIGFPKLWKKGTLVALAGGCAHLVTALFLLYGADLVARLFADLSSAKSPVPASFFINLAQFFVLVLCTGLSNFLGLWCGRKAGVYLRQNLELYLHDLYFSNKVLYTSNSLDTRLDNIDNRLSGDMDLLASTFSNFFYGDGALNSWSGGLFNLIGVTFVFTIGGISNGYWLDVCLGFAFCIVITSLVTPILMWVSRVSYVRQIAEGDFRYFHGYMRTYAESVALLCGQRAELAIAGNRLQQLMTEVHRWVRAITVASLANGWAIYMASFYLQNWFCWLAITLTPFLGPVPNENSTAINRRVNATSQLLRVLGVLPFLLGRATDMAASIHRISEVVEVFEDLGQRKVEMEKSSRGQTLDSPLAIVFDKVCVPFPAQNQPSGVPPKLLFNNISFEFRAGESTCIMGPSGTGKSSLLRVIAGLWDIQSGVIQRPSKVGRDGVFFVPQRPYITRGTLKDQVVYPLASVETSVVDETLMALLERVGLSDLLKEFGLHSKQEWFEVLSVGQMQRLGFARLFFHKPKFALLDEATSALDEPVEALLLKQCVINNITMISVAHRPAVVSFHDQVMMLDGKGSYNMLPIDGVSFVH
jgi:ATP-binding cassette subfamily D (ALD) protein 4